MRLTRNRIVLLALFIVIIGLWWTINTTQASIDYWLEEKQAFTEGLNSITIYCKNGGRMDGDFRLVLTFVNASFSNQTEKPHYSTNIASSAVQCKFLLHKGESNHKKIYFSIDEKVEGFSLKLSLEKITFIDIFLKPNPRYPTTLAYEWNEQTRSFVLLMEH